MNGEVVATLPNSTPAMVQEAVGRARTAFATWSSTPVPERARLVRRFTDLIVKGQKRILEVMRSETGKTYGGAAAEVMAIAMAGDYYAKHSARWLKPQRVRPLFPLVYQAVIHHKPIGVVGNISAWNYPFLLSFIDMLPALMAGNTVIIKPSELAPLTALEGLKMFQAAGFPPDVVQVVTGDGLTGAALVDAVDFIMFTGSTATGRKIAQRAAERLIPFSLELGGMSPMLVLRDANLSYAAALAVAGGNENAGQMCISVQRVLVEEAVYEPFLAEVRRWYPRLTVGKDAHAIMGTLIHQREFERTRRHIQDALSKGATLVAGGEALPELGPLFHQPTLLTDVTSDMLIMQEETFGPVTAIVKVKDVEEAIRIANETCYGLSASVFGRNRRQARAIAQRIEAGVVNINTLVIGDFGTMALPSGGVKQSGMGRRNGKQGLLKYTSVQSILLDRMTLMPRKPTLYPMWAVWMLRFNRWLNKRLPFLAP
jgi:acyl-CoA reductase-like NAD-dependent aldehyde dehydrogenase